MEDNERKTLSLLKNLKNEEMSVLNGFKGFVDPGVEINYSRLEISSSAYEALLFRYQRIRILKSLILELDQPAQRLFIERYMENKSTKAVTNILNISPATYWRYHKEGLTLITTLFLAKLRENERK